MLNIKFKVFRLRLNFWPTISIIIIIYIDK